MSIDVENWPPSGIVTWPTSAPSRMIVIRYCTIGSPFSFGRVHRTVRKRSPFSVVGATGSSGTPAGMPSPVDGSDTSELPREFVAYNVNRYEVPFSSPVQVYSVWVGPTSTVWPVVVFVNVISVMGEPSTAGGWNVR